MIGSISLFGTGNTYQGVNAKSIGRTIDKNTEASSTLTESQRFTQRHAGLSASDYISSYLEFSQQRSAELLKSGQATDTFSVRFEGRTFSLAGERLGGLNVQAATLADVLKVPVAQAGDVPQAPSSRVDMTA
ncbi:hypothetical protein [Bradyrhizobium sp. SYSU BS000235]|uniref:hypothetical protein n=1 Tax=Bradyrhizobium sp. SYSU BS000235 TaxID=3411332 RepID=UPI003C7635C0